MNWVLSKKQICTLIRSARELSRQEILTRTVVPVQAKNKLEVWYSTFGAHHAADTTSLKICLRLELFCSFKIQIKITNVV